MRVYEKDGKRYLSVTSVVDMMYEFDKDGFESWALSKSISPEWITKHSAKLGTKYHEYFENKFYGISEWADVVDEKDKGYQRAVEDLYSKGWEILDSEQEVYCDEFKYAGRFDLVMRNPKLNIKKAIGDVKTWGAWSGKRYKRDAGKLRKLGEQLSMYRYALGEELPMYLLVPQKSGECVIEAIPYSLEWQKFLKKNWDEILDMVSVNGIMK
jgi:hypothetical protein